MSRRDRRKRTNVRKRGRSGSKGPPGVRSLVLWSLPFFVAAAVVDWLVYRRMVEHYESHGDWHVLSQETVVVIMVTGMAVSIPIVWVLQRRKNGG